MSRSFPCSPPGCPDSDAGLGLQPEARDLLGQRPEGGAVGVFARLLALPDPDVLAIAAVVMADSLAAGSEAVEAAGAWLKVDIGAVWAPDDAFFDLMRDRETVNAMLREVGGKKVADGNLAEKVKTQKAILRDLLEGGSRSFARTSWRGSGQRRRCGCSDFRRVESCARAAGPTRGVRSHLRRSNRHLGAELHHPRRRDLEEVGGA